MGAGYGKGRHMGKIDITTKKSIRKTDKSKYTNIYHVFKHKYVILTKDNDYLRLYIRFT